ncbi:hypothetical protein HBH72_164840 [Parastagonospora nodorum]|nr:hypothetical protein HBH72_164840 [Parastagonospora nodorum]
MHICAADSLSSTITVYNYIKKDKNADLAIANSISDILDICFTSPNYVNIFNSDFAFSFANILLLIAFIISYRLFADKLRLTPSTLLAKFIPTTKIRNSLLKTLENAAKSRILLICADRRTRQYYLTIYAILANYKEQVLLTSIKKNCYCMQRCLNKGHDDFIHLVNYILHLLLKGLVIKMLDFMQDIIEQKAIIQQLIAIVSLLFILKAPFALHFIYTVYNLVTLAQYKSYNENTLAYIQGALERINVFKEEFQVYQQTLEEEKNFNYPKALDSICTRANSKAHYITIVKQFYSIINKKDKIAANIAISNFIYAAVLYLILTIINYTCYNKDRKHIAYIRAFSKVLLFNNNRQINNTTRILTFKFYNLSTIICLVHLVPRDLPNLITYTTMSYYVNNYIN